MAANSAASVQQGKKRTGITSSLTADQALEILQQAIINCQATGIQVSVGAMQDSPVTGTVLVLVNVAIVGDRLVYQPEGVKA